jgi:hypothetical protein
MVELTSAAVRSMPQAVAGQDASIPFLTGIAQLWLRRLSFPLRAAFVLVGLWILVQHPERLPVFLASALPAALILLQALPTYRSALPIFPIFVALQALSFTAPLLNPELAADWRVDITPSLLSATVPPLLLWFASLWLGWRLTSTTVLARQRLAKPFSNALQSPGSLPHLALLLTILLQAFLDSPLYWQSLGGLAQGFVSPLRALIGLLGLAGGFVGAYCWSRGRLRDSLIWAGLLIVPILQAMRSLLLSSLQGILLAALLGMWLGRARRAVATTIAVLLFLSFVNSGKAIMREKYWGRAAQLPANPVIILREWVQASLDAQSDPEGESSDLLTQRFNNLQNLLYVEQKLANGSPTLGGASYAVIPEVLVPRVFDQDKVRSQEGQVILNLYYGRQRNREDTEKASIAWGMLAESVGNFGRGLGPIVIGLLTGFLLRLSENIGRGQFLLSAPGLLSLVLTLLWFTAYEMVYSTVVAAAFQLIVAVSLVGWWFGPRSKPTSTR